MDWILCKIIPSKRIWSLKIDSQCLKEVQRLHRIIELSLIASITDLECTIWTSKYLFLWPIPLSSLHSSGSDRDSAAYHPASRFLARYVLAPAAHASRCSPARPSQHRRDHLLGWPLRPCIQTGDVRLQWNARCGASCRMARPGWDGHPRDERAAREGQVQATPSVLTRMINLLNIIIS